MPEVVDRERRIDLQLPIDVRGETGSGGRFSESSHTLNISGSGVCFESRGRLQIGDRVSLDIQIPPRLQRHFGNEPVYRARGIVYRVERRSGSDVDRVVVRFVADAKTEAAPEA